MRNGQYMLTGAAMAMIGAIIAALPLGLFLVPRAERAFEDFGTNLPGLTALVVGASRWMTGRAYPSQMLPGILYAPVLLAALVMLIAKVNHKPRGADQPKPLRLLITVMVMSAIFALGAMLTSVVVLVAINLPFYRGVSAVS